VPDRPRLLVVVPSDTAPPARLGEWLRAAGLDLDERHLDAGDDLPADLSGHDGLLVTGGPQSSLDDDAVSGLGPVRALLSRALADGAPALGICLGAQLLARRRRRGAAHGGGHRGPTAGRAAGALRRLPVALVRVRPAAGGGGARAQPGVPAGVPGRQRVAVQFHPEVTADIVPLEPLYARCG
jgi:putative intracellular protease/amidase